MGNKCLGQSGTQVYKNKNFKGYLNKGNLNKKYKFQNKVFSKQNGIKIILVYDMVFKRKRILKQVGI